jgi:cysteine desulfurase
MIYADYNGSAPLLPSVKDYLRKRIESDLFANPNAIHSMGQKVSKGIEKCREIIAEVVGCHPDQLIFNSGSSEGVSTILHSVLSNAPRDKRVVITSPIEHVVIPSALAYYQKQHNFSVVKVEVNQHGKVKLSSLADLLHRFKDQVALVTIMSANNETGVIQPYQEIGELCRKQGVEFFSDSTQLIGKGEFHFETSHLDYAICSGHKVGALTGTGFVIAREPRKLKSLIFGSSQEKGLRGGTQNYLGIETLAVALKDFQEGRKNLNTLKAARLKFETEMKSSFPQVCIIGDGAERLAGTTLIGFPGLHGQAIQIELETQDIFVTTSAACSDNQPETSAVLKAIGVAEDVGRSVVRISLSFSHGEKDYQLLAHALKAAYTKLTKIQSY